ncbi:MAG: hypothetical protein PVF58_02355 [Candidatus Methanofastidiosia archaeon]|jgi:Zn finger protein HypA/HybF involved in hydrogenase expression
MATAYECESCHTKVYTEGKKKPFCPVCRGRMFKKDEPPPKETEKVHCPRCDREFRMIGNPFKCPFCDHNFRLGSYW